MHLNNDISIEDISFNNDEIEMLNGEIRFLALDKLKFIMMFLVCFFSYGKFTAYYSYASVFARFSVVCFFFISGYFILLESPDRPDRIKRTIKKSAITFGILSLAYIIINIIYYTFILKQNILSEITLSSVFNFVVLNEWPFEIGENIWYVQSILYAYIIIYFLEKFNLLRFDIFISIPLLILNFIGAEFAGLFNFSILGHSSFAPNFLTYALPVILLANFMHRNILLKFTDISELMYAALFAIGIIITFFEWTLLVEINQVMRYDLFVGYIIIAFTLCKFILDFRDNKSMNSSFSEQCDFFARVIYFVSPLIGFVILYFMELYIPEKYNMALCFSGIATFIISFIISDIVLSLKYRIFHRDILMRYNKIPDDFYNKDENDNDEEA